MAIDEEKEAMAAANVLETARGTISGALSFLQRSNAITSATGSETTSFSAALQDAIFEIDSQPDIVDPYLDSTIDTIGLTSPDSGVATAEVGTVFTLGSLQLPRKQGQLQRIRNLKVALFGGYVNVVEDGVTRRETIGGVLEPLKKVASVRDKV
jgi:hypothetical protein